MWLRIVSLVLVYVVKIRTSEPESCPASHDTVSRVSSCPRNREEWEQRSDVKNCSLVWQNCTEASKFVYHCVINSYENETLEVCAPAKERIIEHRCVEYNVGGRLIQESRYVMCNNSNSPCPFSYASTDVYKYQQCFQAIKSSKRKSKTNLHEYLTMESNTSSCVEESFDKNKDRNWQIVAVVMIIINVALFGVTLWMMISKRKTMRCCKADGEGTIRHQPKSDNVNNGGNEPSEEDRLIRENKMSDKGTDNEGENEREKKSDKDDFYVAALDIGEIYFTMALSCPESPEVVKPIGERDRICILKDKEGKFKTFGKEAMLDYIKRNEKDDTLVDDFKLFNDIENEEEEKLHKYVVTQLLKRIQSKLTAESLDVSSINLYVVFIVPKNWEKDAIGNLEKRISEITREEVDIHLPEFKVIKREDTISPFIHEVNARVLCLNFNVDNLVWGPQENKTGHKYYAVLHIGSSHLHLSLRSIGGGDEKELIASTEMNLPHACMLRAIYGMDKNVLSGWRKDNERDYISLLSTFEDLEHKDKVVYKVPKSLHRAALENGFSVGSIERKAKKKKDKGITIKGDVHNEYEFEIDRTFMIYEMIKEVSPMIKENKAKLEEHNVRCVIMTGIYLHEEIVRQRAERKWFEGMQITVAITQNKEVFAMGGAYYYRKIVRKQKQKGVTI